MRFWIKRVYPLPVGGTFLDQGPDKAASNPPVIFGDDGLHVRDEFADAGEATEILEHAVTTFGRRHVDEAIEQRAIGLVLGESGEGGDGDVGRGGRPTYHVSSYS